MEVDADSNEAAEALVDEKLRSFIVANAELTDVLGASAIQGHAVTDNETDWSGLTETVQQLRDGLFQIVIVIFNLGYFLS